MKKENIFLLPVMVLAFFTSCLKDPKITDDLNYGDEGIGKGKLIQFEHEGFGSNFIDNATERKDINLSGIRLNNDNPSTEDITIELAFDQDLLDEYNEENETGYEIPASNRYTLVNGMKVVIPKGERIGYFKINVLPSEFLGGEYAFPLKIVSVTPSHTIASTSHESIMSFGTKNKYDGKYTYKSSANQTLLPNRTANAELVTVGENTVQLKPGLAANYTNVVTYTINPATNQVTTAMTTLLPIGNLPESKYDPATKTFHLRWTSNGGGRLFEETLTYTGPR